MKALLIIAISVLPLTATANPFAKGDVKAGEKLHQTLCQSCHASRFGGDGSKIYTRANRRVKSAEGLKQQIATCNSMLGTQLLPEEEINLGAYLNATFYKFK